MQRMAIVLWFSLQFTHVLINSLHWCHTWPSWAHSEQSLYSVPFLQSVSCCMIFQWKTLHATSNGYIRFLFNIMIGNSHIKSQKTSVSTFFCCYWLTARLTYSDYIYIQILPTPWAETLACDWSERSKLLPPARPPARVICHCKGKKKILFRPEFSQMLFDSMVLAGSPRK